MDRKVDYGRTSLIDMRRRRQGRFHCIGMLRLFSGREKLMYVYRVYSALVPASRLRGDPELEELLNEPTVRPLLLRIS